MGSFKQLLIRHSAKVYRNLEPRLDECLRYLRQEGLFDAGRCAIVDMGWHGTMQLSLHRLLKSAGNPAELFGFYYGLWPKASGNRYATGPMESSFASDFLPTEEQPEIWLGVPLLEQLHSAAHGSTLFYQTGVADGITRPIFQDSPAELKQHTQHTFWFQQGAIEGVKRLFSKDGSLPLCPEDLSRDASLAAMDALFLSPTVEEIKLLAQIGHCATFDHSGHEPIISVELPTARTHRTIMFDRSEWKLGQLRLWWHIANAEQKEWIRRAASERLGYLGERVLRQFT